MVTTFISLPYKVFFKRQVLSDYVCINIIVSAFLKLVNAVLVVNSLSILKLVN